KNVHEKLTVILRQGGIGRFDERDATMIIEHIVQLLSDEGAAFSVLGRSFLSGELEQLQQIIYKLEQQMTAQELNKAHTPFLILRKEKNAEVNNISVQYWSTSGEQGNDIKAGTPLLLYHSEAMFDGSSTLVTTSLGGRNR